MFLKPLWVGSEGPREKQSPGELQDLCLGSVRIELLASMTQCQPSLYSLKVA